MFKNLLNEKSIISSSIVLIVFLSLLRFGQPASINLDPSWTASLGYAFEHNLQAGIDYVFTFAPLGYYQHLNSSYIPSLFEWFLFWKIISALIIALLIVAAFYIIPSNIDKFLYLISFFFIGYGGTLEKMYFVALIVSFIFAIRLLEEKILTWQAYLKLAIIFLFFIWVALGKLTFFIWMCGAVFALFFMAIWQHSWRVAIWLALIHSILFMFFWTILGQELINIPAFFLNSLEVSSGFSEAMTILYSPTQLFYAAMIFITIFCIMVLNFWKCTFKLSNFIISGIILFTLFLAFKGAFVRQDSHILIFFATAIVIVFLVESRKDKLFINLIQRFLRYLVVCFAFYGVLVTGGFGVPYKTENVLTQWTSRITSNTYKLFHLSEIRKDYENQWLVLKQQYDLPEMRKIIGQSTVDIFSWEQTVIFLNDFNWHPRPVFQSYKAYTKKLIEINKQFFLTSPPDFVILKLQAIDFQFPLANDADSYKFLLQEYQPVLEEKDYLLLKHVKTLPVDGLDKNQILLQKDITEGEWLDISKFAHQSVLLTLKLPKSWLGKVWTLLYRLPEVYLETKTTEGIILKHRLIPRMAETGFVYNPLILSQTDFKSWYNGQPLQRAQAFRIVINPVWTQSLFNSKFEIKLTEFVKSQ